MAQPQYSDLPQGAKIVAGPVATETATYSDLPEGAKIVSPSSSSSLIKLPDPNAPHTISDTSFGGGVETGMGLPAPISDAAEGIGQLLRHPINSLEAIADNNFKKNFPGGVISEKDALAATKKGAAPVPANEPDFYHYTPSPIVEAVKKGHYANAAGQIVGGVGTGLGLGRLAVGPAEPQPLARENATHVIASAVNPDAAEAPGFRANVAQQLDTIVNHGREIGADAQLRNAKSPGEALDTFAKTAESAAANDPYYVNYLKPNLDVETGTTGIPGYRGGSSAPNHATVGQLSARLKDINSQLNPRYNRGGAGSAAANAAVNAADVAPLQAEAAGIRNTIVDALSRKMGIPVEQLEPLRANYGQLNDIADTARYYADKTLGQENAVRNAPLTLADFNPFESLRGSASTFVGKRVPLGPRSPQGRALAGVFQNFPASGALPPEPQVPPAKGGRPAPPYDPNRPPDIIPIRAEEFLPPTTPTGKPLTVRVQRAAEARQAAERARAEAPPLPPPNAPAPPNVPDVVSQTTNASTLARGGGVRVPKQLPSGPPPPAQLPTNASPIPLPPSTLPEPIASAIRGGEPQLFGKVKLGYQGKALEGNGLFGRDMGMRTPPPSEADYVKAFGRTNPFANEGRVNVMHPDGTPGSIPASQLPLALSNGYKLTEPLK